jgi:imidazole glycerol-phosphate synthase subunit HisH
MPDQVLRVAIADYGLGNLFSVQQACAHVGITAEITADPALLSTADGVILPGVGAFGDAMNSLDRLELVPVLRDVATSGVPLLAICLGAQLLLETSEEFGRHDGLGVIPGRVVSLGQPLEDDKRLKVPHVGWNRVYPSANGEGNEAWHGTLMEEQSRGEFMYFVHSFMLQPDDAHVVLAESVYGDLRFCSGMAWDNVTALQFHPERSGQQGLRIYERFAGQLRDRKTNLEG